MERPLTLKPLSIPDENAAVHRKKVSIDGKPKPYKTTSKKGGRANETRKALNDITNKSTIPHEASSRKEVSQDMKCNVASDGEAIPKRKAQINEELNIAEEGFLHDHEKCIKAQKTAMELDFWNTVLPGHESEDLMVKELEIEPGADSKHTYLQLEELSMEEFSDFFMSSWKSPPISPVHSPRLSPFKMEIEQFELVLKEDDCSYL